MSNLSRNFSMINSKGDQTILLLHFYSKKGKKFKKFKLKRIKGNKESKKDI